MSKANYQQIPALLKAREPFEGNTMSAKKTWDGTYSVYSFDTVIAQVLADGSIEHNETKYSQTTTKHQNLCKAYL